MAFNFNNKSPKKILFNGKNVAKLIYNGIVVWMSKLIALVTGKFPLTLENSTGEELVDYKIYGESIQDGEPTPENLIEVESVGERTKNLFDANNADIFKGYITSANPPSPYASSTGSSFIIPIKANTTYTISKIADAKFRVATFVNYPSTTEYASVWDTSHNTSDNITITSSKNDAYMMVFYADGTTTNTEPVLRNSIQVEEGTVATDYEPYGYKVPVKVTPKLFPTGYTELESISSNGYEYIDTELTLQNGDEILLDYEFLGNTPSDMSADMFFFGTQTIDSSKGGTWVEMYRTTSRWYVRMASSNSASKEIKADEKIGRHLISLKQGSFSLDGVKILSPDNINVFQDTHLILFGRLNPGGTFSASKIKVYSFKVVNENKTRLDLVPCKSKNGEIGMYDFVTGKFLTNSGTGAFIAGQEATQDSYTQLDYIESTKVQYIDTGIKGELNSEIELDALVTSEGYGQLFGDITDTNSAISGNVSNATGATANNRFGSFFLKGVFSLSRDNNFHKVLVNKTGFYVDEIKQADYDINTQFTTANNLLLFRAFGSTAFLNMAVKRFIHRKNGIVIQDLVPCKNSNGEIGMYDTVTNTFFANQGTENFIAGPETSTTTNIYLNEPLRKVGDYADYIDSENGKVVRKVGKIEDLLTLSFAYDKTYSRGYATIPNFISLGLRATPFLSNGLKSVDDGRPIAEIDDFSVYSAQPADESGKRVYIKIKLNTLTDFLNKIKNVNLFYILNNQTEESIELPAILTQEGTNVISVDTKIQPSNGEIKYYKK